ncbi:right-handed parallel beta-helix repeat-containing protein [Paenibacillus sp. sptzw28]|uniref:right-handed parallel beta-helix repeat-containing protein n=1 Tax=Paenibacillus sp. sptzw28 TaxID=715179 RepID=UPI001C6EDCE5|nr:right-handed parallel beta-helix repeat-containing protein [Paenibacillus sp. sptzw28]QYR22778.1 right-handed parallel beta-helix repeat-containing protein [Paenibacillus sp. sptzw28]
MANEWQVPGDFPTINSALASPLVMDYDTIRVAPGLYTNATEGGPIIVTKIVQLLGAQANVDARTRPGTNESIIEIVDPNGSVLINQNNVVFNGFTVRNNTTGFGIVTSSLFSGYWIFNNIVENNEGGLYFNSDSTSPDITFSQAIQNFFRANNQPGGAGGNGIYSDIGAVNILIDSNQLTGHQPAASINFASVANTQENIVISNNLMVTDNSIALINTTNVKIRDNRMIDTQGSSIFIAGGNNLIEIEGNHLQNSVSNGIYVNTIFLAVSNTNIRAKNNTIQGNDSAGLRVDAGAYDDTPPNRRLDATNNFWGSKTGPTNPANPGGTGDAVIDDNVPSVVEFIPFLTTNLIGPTCEELLAMCQAELNNTLIQFIQCQQLLETTQAQLLDSQRVIVENQINAYVQLINAANLINTAQAQVLECQAALASV